MKPKINSLTLKEAYSLALTEAIRWCPQAKLCFLSSVDKEQTDNTSGSDGKRRFWNLQFANSSNNQSLYLSVNDGQVINAGENTCYLKEDKCIQFDDVVIDSDNALDEVKSYTELIPGKVWAKGYNFSLYKSENNVYISVVGFNKSGYFTRIKIDAKNGGILSESNKVPHGGGIYQLKNKKSKVIFNDDITINGIFKSANNQKLVFYGYTDLFCDYRSVIKMSNDGGNSWSNVIHNTKDEIIKLWFDDCEEENLYACTSKYILKSIKGDKDWMNILEFDSPILGINMRNKYISILTNKRIYISNDYGDSWDMIDCFQDAKHIKVDSSGALYISNNNEIFKLIDNTWTSRGIPLKDGLLGIELYNNILVSYNKNQLAYLSTTGKWNYIDICDGIKHIYIESYNDNIEQLFIITNKGHLQEISFREGIDVIIKEKISLDITGEVSSIISMGADNYLLSVTPQIMWNIIEGNDLHEKK